MPQNAPTRTQRSAPSELLVSLNLGVNGYTDPSITKPQMWTVGTNCYSGAFAYVQRCRFANVVQTGYGQGGYGNIPYGGLGASGLPYTSLKYYATPTTSAYLLADIAGKMFSFDTGNSYTTTQRFNPYIDPTGAGSASLNGPWARETIQNIAYEMNGQVSQAGRGANAATIEKFGLDTPDASPQVTFLAGTTASITSITRSNGIVTAVLGGPFPFFNPTQLNVTGVTDTNFNGTFVILTQSGGGTPTVTWSQLGQNVSSSGGSVNNALTKAVGRSYAFAWENANKAHVGAPSPATQYIAYANQAGIIICAEPGTVTIAANSTNVTGGNTFFTSAWVGRSLWAQTDSNVSGNYGRILSVQSPTQLTLATPSKNTQAATSQPFQIFDPQSTHIRLYATADGGATYFRIQRNAWLPNTPTPLQFTGLQFTDNANAEPPAFPFITETAQLNNIPPPVGNFLTEYQGVLCVFGVTGALQSFFYSNQSATSVGQPQESYAPLNQVTLPIQNATLVGGLEFPGSFIIWSDHQDMFRLQGLLTDNVISTSTGTTNVSTATTQGATITRLPYALGLCNPFACDITPLGGFWVTPNAEIWLFTDRYAPRNVGKPIQHILNTISPSQLKLVRVKYFHTNLRNWLAVSVPANASSSNNTVLVLDLDLLASNGSPSYFTFDMATNHPSWWVFQPGPVVAGSIVPRCDSLEVVYEQNGAVRLFTGSVDLIQDLDFQTGLFGTEQTVPGAGFTTHAWGNETAPMIKRPGFMRFTTNRNPAGLAADGWSFACNGIDDDKYTFDSPLTLPLVPGTNDMSSLCGNPNLAGGEAFRHSPEVFRIGGVNFVMGRRLQFTVNFPSAAGAAYQFRSIQLGFGPTPPR